MARLTQRLNAETGLTLAESVIALGILTVGLTALLSAFPLALSAVQFGRQSSTAVFLAIERLEAIKAFAASADPAQGFDNVTAANFPAEPYATIAGYPRYRRGVTIVDSAPAPANTKVVQVTVFYHASGASGRPAHETAVSISTLIAWR